MKRRLFIASLMSLVLVSLLFVGDTFSIFMSEDVDENANVYTTGNLNVTYTLSDDNVTIDENSPLRNEDAIKVTPYRVTVKNVGTVAYKFNVLLNDTTSKDRIDYKYVMTQVGKYDVKSLDSCKNSIIFKNIVVPANDSVDVDVRVWLSDSIPNSEIGKSFYAKLSISGVATYDDDEDVDTDLLVADRLMLGTKYIENLYNDGNKIQEVVLGVDMSRGKVYQNISQKIMLDNNGEYRYFGSNPNNYVEFNNELWRIIGVANTYKEGENEKTEKRLKIIRSDYLKDEPKYSNNNYIRSSVNYYLNEDYYKTLTTRSRSFMDSAMYYLGGIDSNYYASNSYVMERGFKVFNCDNDSCGGMRETKVNTFIGLMYASDYLYATDLSKCFFDATMYNEENCYGNDWLNKEPELTITPSFSNANDTYGINDNKLMPVRSSLKIRPVLYLKKNIAILSGNGTKDRPYKIDLLNVK